MWSTLSHFRMARQVSDLFFLEINLSYKSDEFKDALSHRNLTWASSAVMRNSGSSLHISSIRGINHLKPRYFCEE